MIYKYFHSRLISVKVVAHFTYLLINSLWASLNNQTLWYIDRSLGTSEMLTCYYIEKK